MSDTRKYRKLTAQQKTEIVLASLRGPKSMAELGREHEIADSLLREWREQFLTAGAERLQGRRERTEADELGGRVALGVGAGAHNDGGRGGGGTLARLGVRERVARSREWSRTAARRRSSLGSLRLVARRSSAVRYVRRARSVGRPIRSIGSCWRSRSRTRPTATGWSRRSRAASSAVRSTASACSGSCAASGCCGGVARKGGADGRGSSASSALISSGIWTRRRSGSPSTAGAI